LEDENVYLTADAQSSGSSSSFGLIMIVLLIGAMYFLMIRPQSKRRREAAQMQGTLRAGDEIVTIGGLYGTVTAVDDDSFSLEVAPDVVVRYTKGAVARVVSKSPEPETDTPESGAIDSDAPNTFDQA
jgi:preprotein translocase subunit YajC